MSTFLNTFICDIISPEQVGFVKGRNIESNLHSINSIINECPESYLIAVDFEKAFDSLLHPYLMKVLEKFNFPDKFICLIKKFLSSGKSCLTIGGKYSEYFTVQKGVRQGDPLSGLLFIIAMEPLLRCQRVTNLNSPQNLITTISLLLLMLMIFLFL